jgi:hypothetical protein
MTKQPLTPQQKDEKDAREFQDKYEELCNSTGLRLRIVFSTGDDGRLITGLGVERFNVPSS